MEEIRKWYFKSQSDQMDYPEKGYFIGTKEEFDQMRLDYENLWGLGYWDIYSIKPTKEEIEIYEAEKEEAKKYA